MSSRLPTGSSTSVPRAATAAGASSPPAPRSRSRASPKATPVSTLGAFCPVPLQIRTFVLLFRPMNASSTRTKATKGERTRAAILDAGFHIVSRTGLEGLTVGTLADATGMSKSGLFAHFGSREELLLAVLDRGQQEFIKLVVNPALAKPRGLPRLKALFVEWLGWTESADLPGGCPMIGGAIEFDDKPGVVRDALAAGQRAWIDT